MSKRSRLMKSTVHRPVIARMPWSSSPGQTTTCTGSPHAPAAIMGELVTIVSPKGGASISVSASASVVDDESRKIVEPGSIDRAA